MVIQNLNILNVIFKENESQLKKNDDGNRGQFPFWYDILLILTPNGDTIVVALGK